MNSLPALRVVICRDGALIVHPAIVHASTLNVYCAKGVRRSITRSVTLLATWNVHITVLKATALDECRLGTCSQVQEMFSRKVLL